MTERMTYDKAVEYLEDVPRFTKKTELSNTVELLRRLGHPEEKYEVIHVAGTNGKGSVCAFMASALEASGRKTGLFTSPHLTDIRERFQVNRRMVSREEFTDSFLTVRRAVEEMEQEGFQHPAYFEFLFAMGMLMFERAGIDVLVMETGLGGRLDATSAVAHPKLSVITSISLDHMQYLGNTISQIAAEKAGILKEGVPVVYDAMNREAAAVIAGRARELHCLAIPVYRLMAQTTRRTDKSIDFVLNNRYYEYRSVTVPFPADYQVMNCIAAMTALRIYDRDKLIPDELIAQAMERTKWSGRMEQVLPGVFLDGAHNTDGIRSFLETVKVMQERRPVSLLFAAVSDKNYEEMIRELCTQARFEAVTVTTAGGSRNVPAQKFAELFRNWTKAPVRVEPAADAAFEIALKQKGEDGILFCAGSLYLVGEIKAYLASREKRCDTQ